MITPKRILLCDDSIHILRAAEFKLKAAGYHVETAHDGQEAWERIEIRVPDLLVTDCQMPRLDGLQLAQKLRRQPETCELPIIMLTAKGFELSHEELAEKWQVAAVMGKPFSPRELLQLIEQTLEEKHVTA